MTAIRLLGVSLLVALAGLMLLGGIDASLLAAPYGQDVSVEIASPGANEVVRGTVSIKGSASIPSFQFYKVEYGMGADPGQWTVVNAIRTTPVEDGLLEVWETTLIPDGPYTLLLTVVEQTGNYREYRVQNVMVANAEAPSPTATPPITPAESPTPTATLPLVVVPTATPVVVGQPDVGEEEAPPTPDLLQPIVPTPEAAGPLEGITRGLGLDLCGQAFCIGGGIIGFFVTVVTVAGLLRWLIRTITKPRSREGP